jgi:hypothetical protein
MISKGIVHGTTTPPTRLDVAMWVKSAMEAMKGEGQMYGMHGGRRGLSGLSTRMVRKAGFD